MKTVEIFGTKDPNIFRIIINTVSSSFFNILRKKEGTGYIIPAGINPCSSRVMEQSITIKIIDLQLAFRNLAMLAKEKGYEFENKILQPMEKV